LKNQENYFEILKKIKELQGTGKRFSGGGDLTIFSLRSKHSTGRGKKPDPAPTLSSNLIQKI